MVYGPAAPDLLRQMAGELEWLEPDRRGGISWPVDRAGPHQNVAN